MNFEPDMLKVAEGAKVDLADRPTRIHPVYGSKQEYQAMLADHIGRLDQLQRKLYADNRFAVLLIFQAMDAAGKDSVIRHVMSGINPQGCEVFSFKHPSAEELEHDFLWRTSRCLPERGRIGIFNRSYYEEVLIVRVHPEILARQNIPHEQGDGMRVWQQRYQSIIDQERHLHRNGTRIVKFFLHLSRDEQKRRFLSRIDKPEKNWKFSIDDIEERQYWPRYMEAYEACLGATSTSQAPWYVIPADDRKNARLIVSRIILDTLERLQLDFPVTSPERRKELLEIRRRLEQEK